MFLFRRPVIIVLIFIALLVVGFMALLRGCLSHYDERSAIAPALYFQKDGIEILFTVVKFDKTTSYSQKGNFISKSVSTRYYIQNNDVVTAKKLADKKVKHHSDIKTYPVEVLGASAGRAWVFLGELMAFDPFTLDVASNLDVLEEKNPALKDKFPSERRFYTFNHSDQSIHFVATDGSPWTLNTSTLEATPATEERDDDADDRVEVMLKQNKEEMDSLIENLLRRPSRLIAAKQITMSEYSRLSNEFRTRQSILYRQRDSLNKLSLRGRTIERMLEDRKRRVESLRGKTGLSFSQVKGNMDTLAGSWYGVYTRKELDRLWDRFQTHSTHDETARRELMQAGYSGDDDGNLVFDKKNAKAISHNVFFLNGGFLLEKNTAMPIRRGDAFFVVHKSIVGNEGVILLSIVDKTGKVIMQFDSQLKEWSDWIMTKDRLLVFGRDNKELSGNDVNVFLSFDLTTGKIARYDYYTDK